MKPSKYSGKGREYTKWSKNFKEVRVSQRRREEAAPAPALQVDAAGDEADGAYCNLAVITHTETEFLADFIFAPAAAGAPRLARRVLLHPVMAKALAAALHDNLRRYELRFGPVKGR